MKKKALLPLVTVVALLTMPVSQAMAAPKPTPPAGNSGGQMDMTSSQMASSQPAMSGWDMVKMRTTAKMREKAARNAKLKGKPAQAVAATTFDAAKGPDYFGTTPNYASSPMPHVTWKVGGDVVLPIYDPTTGMLSDPRTPTVRINVVDSPYAVAPDAANLAKPVNQQLPLLDPINQIPQLDYAKVNVSGGVRKFIQELTPNYVPVAVPDTTTYPGSDFYQIGLKDYTQKFSPDLPATQLRGYYQKNAPAGSNAGAPFYLGPIIVANSNRPVRIEFTNELPTDAGGDLFLPVDTTAMGAGKGPDGTTDYKQSRAVIHLHGGLTPWISDGTPNQWTTPAGDTTKYPKGVSVYGVPDMPAVDTVNADGTKKAASNDGKLTFYYTNKQSARLMWYHDHAYGLTRLNVYAGEVSAYRLDPPLAKDAAGKDVLGQLDPNDPQTQLEAILPKDNIPLVIQDKGFVPDNTPSGYFPDGQLTDQDPTWDTTKWGGTGNLWFPHVYMPNQNPYDNSGANAMGRWDYGPWFWPIFGTSAGLAHGEIPNPYAGPAASWEPPMIPGTPSTYAKTAGLATSDVSLAPEAFVDTAVVNGIAYPYMNVKPQAYRFRILNGANDRYWNLQMYCSAYDMKVNAANAAALASYKAALAAYNADPAIVAYNANLTAYNTALTNYNADLATYNQSQAQYLIDLAAYNTAFAANAADGTTLVPPVPVAPIAPAGPPTAPTPPAVTAPVPPAALAKGQMWASTDKNAMPTNADAGEVPMVQAVRTAGFPAEWPTDGRDGGVPDPAAAAGNFLQIGTEGGVLPNAVDVENQPVNYVYNRRDIIVLSISTHALLLGPAERADVVYDFSKAQAMGCTNVILYNDSPTPVPAFDPRNDYYSNNPDQTDSGGTPSTLPGYGPNTRTIMQFRIDPKSAPVAFNDGAVRTMLPKVFAAVQNKPIVPEKRFSAAYGCDPKVAGSGDPICQSDVYSRIQSTSVTFNTSSVGDVGALQVADPGSGYAPIVTVTPVAGNTPTTEAKLVPVIGRTGNIASVTVVNGGAGYTAAPTIEISTPVAAGARQAKGTAVLGTGLNAGKIVRVTFGDRGAGYSVGATLSFTAPPTGNTAAGTATVDLNTGVINALTLTDVGNGYVAAPTVSISAPLYGNAAVLGTQATATATLATGVSAVKMPADPKAIQELFEMDYGRMNATLGVELPFTNARNQTTLPMGYTEPTTEYLKPTKWGDTQIGTTRDGTAVWKITHNGVDTHTIHFHLMDVQLINRVGWDGAIRPPDDNEMGWKESVRMNPLEDAIVAMRPATPELPFKIGESIRSIDPTMPANHQMSSIDPVTGNAITFSNAPVNMGWEYVWHCHLLGHEENDMMREVNFAGSPDAPTLNSLARSGAAGARTVTASWTNNANWQLTNFVVQRSTSASFNAGTVETLSDKAAVAGGSLKSWQGNPTTLGGVIPKTATSFADSSGTPRTTYYYRVRAESAQGYSVWSNVRSATF
jgi:FtsP/CotA-like multicopper oxidase with cupredoxin domain